MGLAMHSQSEICLGGGALQARMAAIRDRKLRAGRSVLEEGSPQCKCILDA